MKHPTWQRLSYSSKKEQRRAQEIVLRRYVREELYPFCVHYRRVFDRAGVDPRSVRSPGDLARLPFTTRADLARADSGREFLLAPTPRSIREHWPFSRKFALVAGGRRSRELLQASYEPCAATLAEDGEHVTVEYTLYDLALLTEVGARVLDVGGLEPDALRFAQAFACAAELGFLRVAFAGFKNGCLVLPEGLDQDAYLEARGQVDALAAAPAFVRELVRAARERGDELTMLRAVVLTCSSSIAEARGLASELEACGARGVTVARTYSCPEARMAFAECPNKDGSATGFHLYPDHCVVEIVDPDTLVPLPDGQPGEVVLTPISGHGTCLLRFRTGDVAALTREPCPGCGRTVPRLSADLRPGAART